MALFWTVFTIAIIVVVSIFIFSQRFGARRSSSLKPTLDQSRLTAIIDNLEEGVVAYDENFTILVFNPAAEKIFGISAEEVLNQSFTLKIREGLPPHLRPLLVILFPALATTIIRRSAPGAFPQIFDVSFEDPQLELRVTSNKITGLGGETGFIKLIHDRTRELTLVHEKSEFIMVASHQLRTPLSGARWALQNLKKENLSSAARELVENMTGAVNRMMKITEDLLDVAKIEEGQFGYRFTEFDVVDFLQNALTQAKPVADEYGVRLFFEKPKEGSLKITADPSKLGMVLANLLDNALKYNVPSGEVTVRVEKIPNQSWVKISVHDTGIGISKEDAPHIFTKFFRAENAIKTAVEGTGFGLYIAKNIIRRHGGDIAFESTLNRGSTFAFTLPTNQALIPEKEFAGGE